MKKSVGVKLHIAIEKELNPDNFGLTLFIQYGQLVAYCHSIRLYISSPDLRIVL